MIDNDNELGKNGEVIIYSTDDGQTHVDVRLENEDIWLTQKAMAELFGVGKAAISKHLSNIFESDELDKGSVVSILETTANDGKNYKTTFYNLDAIIAVGYRVNSRQATAFRKWATKVLREYMIKGFAMNDERLKGNGGGNYWKELLGRIRDIRSSEKVLYRQVLDLYATAVDYDPHSDESVKFFKIVQNKLHYATHGHTAAELIYERADADKPFMGLTNFNGELPTLSDAKIAKNYLSEDELKVLNNLVSGYFDLAEISAIERKPMYMSDYVQQLDQILTTGNRKLLSNAGRVSHDEAMAKTEAEYRKYQVNTISPVEQAYLDTINDVNKIAKENTRRN